MSDFENISISDNDSFVDIQDSFINIQDQFINIQDSDVQDSDVQESDVEVSDVQESDVEKSNVQESDVEKSNISIFKDFDLGILNSVNISKDFDSNIKISNNYDFGFLKDINISKDFDPCFLKPVRTDNNTIESIYLDIEDDVKSCEQLILSGTDFSIFTDFGTKVISSCEAIIRSSEEYLNEILGADSDNSDDSCDIDINIPPEPKQVSDVVSTPSDQEQDSDVVSTPSEQEQDSDTIRTPPEYEIVHHDSDNDILSEHGIVCQDYDSDTHSEHEQVHQDNDSDDIEVKEIKFQDLCKNDKIYKQLKILCRNNTGEPLRLFGNDLIIYVKMGAKIIGMCSVAMKSPNDHFDNEIYDDIPYLYNFICDKSKKKKQSLLLMNYIKNWAIKCGKKYINLDVLADNKHAQNFFEKNNFKTCGIYRNIKYNYIMYTYTLSI
jgi:hypothetical protein